MIEKYFQDRTSSDLSWRQAKGGNMDTLIVKDPNGNRYSIDIRKVNKFYVIDLDEDGRIVVWNGPPENGDKLRVRKLRTNGPMK